MKKEENKIQTPTLDKMLDIKEESQLCGEFLEWLQKRYAMFDVKIPRKDPFYYGTGDYINTEKVLADFFDVDLAEAEKERQRLLQAITNSAK